VKKPVEARRSISQADVDSRHAMDRPTVSLDQHNGDNDDD